MNDQALREHLLYLLHGGGAHLGFDDAIADLPKELRGAVNAGEKVWRVAERMQW